MNNALAMFFVWFFRYQLLLEVRTITWFIATRLDSKGVRMGLDRVPSAALCEVMLHQKYTPVYSFFSDSVLSV
jgi:hypothetical protein